MAATVAVKLNPFDALALMPLPDMGRVTLTFTPPGKRKLEATMLLPPPVLDGPWGYVAGLYPDPRPDIPEPFPRELVARMLRWLVWRWVYVDVTGPHVYWPNGQPLADESPWGIFPDRATYERALKYGGLKGEVWNLEDDEPLPKEVEAIVEWTGPARAGTRYVVVRPRTGTWSVYGLLNRRGVSCMPCDDLTGRHNLRRIIMDATGLDTWTVGGIDKARERYGPYGWPTLMRRAGLPVSDAAAL